MLTLLQHVLHVSEKRKPGLKSGKMIAVTDLCMSVTGSGKQMDPFVEEFTNDFTVVNIKPELEMIKKLMVVVTMLFSMYLISLNAWQLCLYPLVKSSGPQVAAIIRYECYFDVFWVRISSQMAGRFLLFVIQGYFMHICAADYMSSILDDTTSSVLRIDLNELHIENSEQVTEQGETQPGVG